MNLINKFYELRGSKYLADCEITKEDLHNSKTVLFSMFSRYGDFFGTLKVINEFTKKYGDKKLVFVIPPQFAPYIKLLLPSAVIVSVNKRNPLDLINAIVKLKSLKPDIGFNPWSHGSESEYFISFAKKYRFYTNDRRCSPPYTENLYDKPRIYLNVEVPNWNHEQPILKTKYKQIIICPESSDIEKSLNDKDIKTILSGIQNLQPKNIVLAASSKFFRNNRFDGIQKIILGRSKKASLEFLNAMINSDLLITADSGPMHFGYVLNMDIIAYFSKTVPEWVLDSKANIIIQRTSKLKNLYCQHADNGLCKDSICMRENFKNNSFLTTYEYSDLNTIKRVNYCAMLQ